MNGSLQIELHRYLYSTPDSGFLITKQTSLLQPELKRLGMKGEQMLMQSVHHRCWIQLYYRNTSTTYQNALRWATPCKTSLGAVTCSPCLVVVSGTDPLARIAACRDRIIACAGGLSVARVQCYAVCVLQGREQLPGRSSPLTGSGDVPCGSSSWVCKEEHTYYDRQQAETLLSAWKSHD